METTERLLRAVLRLHLLPALRCWELECFPKRMLQLQRMGGLCPLSWFIEGGAEAPGWSLVMPCERPNLCCPTGLPRVSSLTTGITCVFTEIVL